MAKLGLTLLPKIEYASPALTAALLPDGINAGQVMQHMMQEHQVAIGQGVGELSNKLLRVAHMGYVFQADITDCLNALELSLQHIRTGD